MPLKFHLIGIKENMQTNLHSTTAHCYEIIHTFTSNRWIELKFEYVQEESKWFRSNGWNAKLILATSLSE